MSGQGNMSRRAMLWSAVVGWFASGRAGRDQAVAQPVAETSKSRPRPSHVDVGDFGAKGDGIADDLGAILRATAAALTELRDESRRAFAGEIKLPAGRYRINGPLEFAPPEGLAGLTVSGTGVGTEIILEGKAATILCRASRGITFRDLAFRSATGVDDDQAAFTIDHAGNALRSWRFERCDFTAFYRCFVVRGDAMASEFFFDKCQFSQCYHLMDNENDQAVNWNFVNCNWENGELDTRKDVRLASAFLLKKGTFVTWTGGSLIFLGRLVLYMLPSAGRVQRPAHMITFDGVRIELEDEGKGHVPFVDRVDTEYISGTNQPTTTFQNCTILNRGAIPPTVTYARAWANCSLSFVNCKAEGGQIVGVLDGVSPTQTASIMINNCKSISYVEDRRARLNSHDQHSLTISPDQSSAGSEPIIEQRLCSLTAPVTVHPKYMYVRGPTGSLPLADTTVRLTGLPDHTMLLRLFVRRFHPANNGLIVELRDAVQLRLYAKLTLRGGVDRFAEADIGAEIGFQIPGGVPLILQFHGVPETVKGIVGIEYL